MHAAFTVVLIMGALLVAGCVRGNLCERRLILEEEVCFPELEQPHDVEECVDTDKVVSRCAVNNEDAYCDYFLWQNRAAARQAGYAVGDYVAPNNAFVACLEEAGLEER